MTAGYIQHPVEKLRDPMELVQNFVLRPAGLLPSTVITPLKKAA